MQEACFRFSLKAALSDISTLQSEPVIVKGKLSDVLRKEKIKL